MHTQSALALTFAVSIQGNHHIKRVGGVCVDSKPTPRRPPMWFAQRHMLTGFANTLDRRFCNGKFVQVGERIILRATQRLVADTEMIANYERTD